MRSPRRADVLAPRTTCAIRFAIYTRASTAPELAPTSAELHRTRAIIEESVLAQAADGFELAGATYDDVTGDDAPEATPAFERLLGHVAAGRVHHVFVVAAERVRGPLAQTTHQITRLKDAGAHVCALALFDDESLGVLERTYPEALQ